MFLFDATAANKGERFLPGKNPSNCGHDFFLTLSIHMTRKKREV
jgi:hypothetical protein